MNGNDQLQASRREMKYIISEVAAQAIREMVVAHIDPDTYTTKAGRQGYYLTSLYVDSAPLSLYRQTRRGEKNRFKLRIRFYDHAPDAPAYLEIKRRQTEAILKERAAITKQAANRLLAGIWPSPDDLIEPSPKSIHALDTFCELTEKLNAHGVVFVGYRREAYMTPNSNRVRVTFDRELTAYRFEQCQGLRVNHEGYPVDMNGVILEFKFTDRFPGWMHEIVQLFGLQKRSVPKYVKCVNALRSAEIESPFGRHEVA